MTKNSYLTRLERRRRDASMYANIVFGQTLGWCLSIVGAFYFFIQYEDRALPVLLLGNLLLLLGVGTPQALELPQRTIESISSFVGGHLLRLLLALLYFLLVFPLGLIYQKTKGTVPFYYWEKAAVEKIEGWTPKVLSDEGSLIGKQSTIKSNYLAQLFNHFWKHGELIIMPTLLIILALGLLVVFIQTTPLAPMIYTLF